MATPPQKRKWQQCIACGSRFLTSFIESSFQCSKTWNCLLHYSFCDYDGDQLWQMKDTEKKKKLKLQDLITSLQSCLEKAQGLEALFQDYVDLKAMESDFKEL